MADPLEANLMEVLAQLLAVVETFSKPEASYSNA
jgi:hypothetical protein